MKTQNKGERLKYLLLRLPKEKPHEVYNDWYKKEVILLINQIKADYDKKALNEKEEESN